jgi:photosystem II stability/assembly factor-like uncharacterized protein
VGIQSSSIQALAVNPVQPANVFAGTPNGLFRSDDSAQTWTAAAPDLAAQSVMGLVFDPSLPSAVYAGTASAGVFKSFDSGVTWTASNQGLDVNGKFLPVNRLIVSPSGLYAATSSGVARSTDGGGTWNYLSRTVGAGGFSVYADSNNLLVGTQYFCFPNFLFGGCSSNGGGLLRSVDGGATWKVALPDTVYDFANDPNNSQSIYAAGQNGVYLSIDGGATWTKLVQRPARRILFDPIDSHTIYVLTNPLDSTGAVLSSVDGGQTWSTLFSQSVASPVIDLVVVGLDRSRFFVGGRLLPDCYIAKLGTGGEVLASTLFGGAGTDWGLGLRLDDAGNVYATGTTASLDLPLINALQPSYAGSTDAFVAKFSSDLSQLFWSTYMGGSGSDTGRAVALGSAGELYVVGVTNSADFPVKNALQPTLPSPRSHGFLVKLQTDQ